MLFVCLFTLYWVSPCVVLTMTCTTNKRIIVIPWAVKAVTVGKAPPFLTAHYTGVGWMFTMGHMSPTRDRQHPQGQRNRSQAERMHSGEDPEHVSTAWVKQTQAGANLRFGEGSTSHVVEKILTWWMKKIKQAMKGYPIPKPGPHMSGDLINAWTDAAGPSLNHVRGVGVAIPGYGWTFLSWPTWMEFMASPIWDNDNNCYMEVHTNKMSMLKELGALAALCMLNKHACSTNTHAIRR